MKGGFSARSPEPPRDALSGGSLSSDVGAPAGLTGSWGSSHPCTRLPLGHCQGPGAGGADFHQTSALATRRGASLASGLRRTRLFSLLPAAQGPLLLSRPSPAPPGLRFLLKRPTFSSPFRDQPQPQPETPGNPSTCQPTCGTPALPPGLLASHTSGGCFSFLNFI